MEALERERSALANELVTATVRLTRLEAAEAAAAAAATATADAEVGGQVWHRFHAQSLAPSAIIQYPARMCHLEAAAAADRPPGTRLEAAAAIAAAATAATAGAKVVGRPRMVACMRHGGKEWPVCVHHLQGRQAHSIAFAAAVNSTADVETCVMPCTGRRQGQSRSCERRAFNPRSRLWHVKAARTCAGALPVMADAETRVRPGTVK